MLILKLLTVGFILLFIGCSDPLPTVVYEEEDTEVENQALATADSNTILVAGLPIHFDSTQYLIHPIGKWKLKKEIRKIDFGSSYSEFDGFSIGYASGYSYTGNISNLKFQHFNSSTRKVLTTKPINIQSFTFLISVFHDKGKALLLYSLFDKDTNKDKELNSGDVEALYISTIKGEKFKKLSPDLHELIDWAVLEVQNRLYFRTIEDLDRNGEFDKKDRIHYFFVDFDDSDFKVEEYDIAN